MTGKTIQCRWGILGCGPEAASFVADIQAADWPSAGRTTAIEHSIVAVSSPSASTSRAFADTHIRTSSASSATAVETFGTSTELHAHPRIDGIFVASPQLSRYHDTVSALRGGKSVLVSKPLAISSTEAKELCQLASRREKDRVKWLGFVMRSRSHDNGLLWAADECAKGLADGREQSELLPWADSLAVLEALDEMREAGAMRIPSEAEHTASFPRMLSGDGSSSSAVNSPADNKRRLSVETSRRPASRSSFASDTAQDDHTSSATLRSQLHELRHVLRQKNALLASLERNQLPVAGRPRAGGRSSLPAQATTTIATPQPVALGARRRTSSLDHTSAVDSNRSDEDMSLSPANAGMPLSDVINTVDSGRSDSPNGVMGRRKRRDANGGRRSVTPDRIINGANSTMTNSLGLSTVREGNSSALVLGEGFLAPTIASENRRVATAAGGPGGTPRLASNGIPALGSPILSPGGGKGTSKVIESLTSELSTLKLALDDAKAQLRTSQRTVSSLQRALDDAKEALGRSRTENETLGQMMARKDKKIQEALDRARKAESESKELGKSSREWGTRMRKIESELGEERILKQRAEVQYEAIAAEWKQIREAWEKEMKELRESKGDAVRKNREEVSKMLERFKAAELSWRGREEEGELLRGVIKELELERTRAANFVQGPVRDLVAQLLEQEKRTGAQDAAVEGVQEELRRIKRLMRTPA